MQSYEESVFTGTLSETLAEFNVDLFNATNDRSTGFYSMASYYMFEALDLPLFAAAFVSPDTNLSTFISVGFDGENQNAVEFAKTLKDNIDSIADSYDLTTFVTIQETGLEYFEIDSVNGVKKDSSTMDEMVGPAAFLVLAIVIQNAPVMIIPFLCIISSLLLQFLIMYLIAQHMDVIAFVPSLMMSLTFATSIDYSLFMLARFCEEQRSGKSIDTSVLITLQSAGMTIRANY